MLNIKNLCILIKIAFLVSFLLFLQSCSINECTVKRKHEKFVIIAQYMLAKNIKNVNKTNNLDPKITKLVRELKIDGASIGNQWLQEKNEPQDSIIVFVKHGLYMFGKHTRIIYDYSKVPFNYANKVSDDKYYTFKKVIDRFYISKEKYSRY